MDIDLELHTPGLDLSSHRWTHHLVFMQEVHNRYDEITALGHRLYEQQGRGTIFVDQEQWRAVIRDAINEEKKPFPYTYLTEAAAAIRFSFGILSAGFRQALAEYDPAQQILLTVHHYPDGPLSFYLLRPNLPKAD